MIIITIISINGSAMPMPAEGGYSATLSDLDSEKTTRSETGVLNRDRVRAGIWKISVKWDDLTPDDLKKLVSATTPEKFNVSFFFGDGMKTAVMYAGDKSVDLERATNGHTRWAFSCNFTQY